MITFEQACDVVRRNEGDKIKVSGGLESDKAFVVIVEQDHIDVDLGSRVVTKEGGHLFYMNPTDDDHARVLDAMGPLREG